MPKNTYTNDSTNPPTRQSWPVVREGLKENPGRTPFLGKGPRANNILKRPYRAYLLSLSLSLSLSISLCFFFSFSLLFISLSPSLYLTLSLPLSLSLYI